jgi:hypothetical protein
MIGDLTNLSKQAIDQRMSQEIADLQKLAESKLKLKNPADLTSPFVRRSCAFEQLGEQGMNRNEPIDLSKMNLPESLLGILKSYSFTDQPLLTT